MKRLSLEQLYYCKDCIQISCNECVCRDLLCYYCPNCLFEVPNASAKAEKYNCSRPKCLKCPMCTCALNLENLEIPNCLFCGWVGSKDTGHSPTEKDIYFKQIVSQFTLLSSQESVEKPLKSTEMVDRLSRLLHSHDSHTTVSESIQDTPPTHIPETRNPIQFKNSRESQTNLEQRFHQLNNSNASIDQLQPLRIPLEGKWIKRCPSCRMILIKPEPKAMSTTFVIKHTAIDYLPSVKLFNDYLEFENNTFSKIKMTLASVSSQEGMYLPFPHFEIQSLHETEESKSLVKPPYDYKQVHVIGNKTLVPFQMSKSCVEKCQVAFWILMEFPFLIEFQIIIDFFPIVL